MIGRCVPTRVGTSNGLLVASTQTVERPSSLKIDAKVRRESHRRRSRGSASIRLVWNKKTRCGRAHATKQKPGS